MRTLLGTNQHIYFIAVKVMKKSFVALAANTTVYLFILSLMLRSSSLRLLNYGLNLCIFCK
jgi:hypothetical protein